MVGRSAGSDHDHPEDLLREILRCSRAHQDWMERRSGIPAAELRVLRFLAQRQPVQVGTLAESMYLHPSTISNLLGKLRRRGWLVQCASSTDRRARLFKLSAHGLEAARKLAPYSRGFAHDVLRSANPAQLQAMSAGLATLVSCIPARWRRSPQARSQTARPNRTP